MDITKANVLITGGSEGIGLGLAKRYLAGGSRVLITGRNVLKLEKAAQDLPGLNTFVSDAGRPEQREALAEYVRNTMPGINVLINNAGIQRRVSLADDNAPWAERQAEIDILLSGPIHLNHLLVPLMLSHGGESVIVNVTSGGAYVPQVFAPVYSACKAALHSYTMTLRHALAGTKCKVIELIPPAVHTSLAGPGAGHGIAVDDFCDAVFPRLVAGDAEETGFGPTANLTVTLSGRPLSEWFEASANRFPVSAYATGNRQK